MLKCRIGIHEWKEETVDVVSELNEERKCIYCGEQQWRPIHKNNPVYTYKWRKFPPIDRKVKDGLKIYGVLMSESDHDKMEYLESKGIKVNECLRKALLRIYINEKSKSVGAVRKEKVESEKYG